jgi:hypothetical protein
LTKAFKADNIDSVNYTIVFIFYMKPLTLRTEILTFGHTKYQCPAKIVSIGIDSIGRDIGITENGEKYLLLPDEKGKHFMSGDSSSWAILHPILLPKFLEHNIEPDGPVEIQEIRDKLDYYLAIYDTASESVLSKILDPVGLVYINPTIKILAHLTVRGVMETFDSFSYPNPEGYNQYEFYDYVTYHDLLAHRINEIDQKYSVRNAPLMGKTRTLPIKVR